MLSENHILMTGATSAIGANCLAQILENSNAKIWLLLRKHPDRRDLDLRLEEVAKLCPPGFKFENYHHRVRAFWGDLRKRQLGIQDDIFNQLCSAAPESVVHLAALTKRDEFSKDALLQTNYEGTNRLLSLASRIGSKRILYLGWLYAFSKKPRGTDYLDRLENTESFYNLNEFVQQITAQNLIRRCEQLDLKWQIICPAYFVDSENPVQIEKRWYFFVAKLVQDIYQEYRSLGKSDPIRVVFPSADIPIALCRPRFAAEVVRKSLEQPELFDGQIFPIIEDRISVRRLLEELGRCHGQIDLSFTESVHKLPWLEKLFMRRSMIFFEYLFLNRTFSGEAESRQILEKLGCMPKVFDTKEIFELGCKTLEAAKALSQQHSLSLLSRWTKRLVGRRQA